MSTITAKDVNELRQITGAGMMDCKKALTESDGSIEKAIEWLRKQGQKVMDKRADRDANEGVVVALTNAEFTQGIVVNICCETDFVSKNDDFVAFAKEIAQVALANMPADKDALNALPHPNGKTVLETTVEKTGIIGEKIEVKAYGFLTGETVVPYIHMGHKAGVIVSLNKAGDSVVEAGKNLAMQVAAMKPIAVSAESISQDTIDREVEIRTEVMMNDPKNAGKPADIVKRMVEGSLNKYFQEVTLLQQDYVKGNKQTVVEYLKTVEKDLTVKDFKHLALK
jgi:elongation factor Ts